MRPTRIGISRSTLPWWLTMISSIGSGRSEGGVPVGQRAPGYPLAQTLAKRVALGPCHRSLPQRLIGATVGLGEYGVPAVRTACCDVFHV